MAKSYGQLEEELWGHRAIPAPDDPGAVTAPSRFKQPLQWVKQALGLQAGEPPQALDTSRIIAAMDVMQGGWPFAVLEGSGLSVAGLVAGAWRVNLTPADTTQQLVIETIAIENQSAANPYAGTLRLASFAATAGAGSGIPVVGIPPQGGLAPATLANVGIVNAFVANWAAAAGGVTTTVDILGARQIIVPPGFVLQLTSVNLLAGDTLILDTTWNRIPAGFRP